MTPAGTFRIPSPAEQDAFAGILSASFAAPADDARRLLERVGSENIRIQIEGGQIAGGLFFYPMGQWFGGRTVSMAGVGGVGIDPVFRGRGVGTRLMRTAVADLAQAGFALATLYPATQPLYRRAGFEQGGSRFEIRIPAPQLALRDHSLPIREERPTDHEAIARLHRSYASARPGHLDRSPLLWSRLRNPRFGEKPTGYLVERGGVLEGYCYVSTRQKPNGRQELLVAELAAATPQAATRLLTFLGDHGSLVDEVIWHGSAADPLLTLLPEQRHSVSIVDVWMLRILDVPAALTARGYPVDLETTLELQIDDEVLPSNVGRFILELSGGSAQVRPGGSGLLRLHARGLAALYSGYLSPAALSLLGLAEGAPEQLARAATIFAGPPPSLPDFF